MSDPGASEEQLERLRRGIVRRDARIAELEREQQRLQYLVQVGNLISGSGAGERTLSEVVSILAQALPLHSAVFIQDSEDTARTLTWLADGEGHERLAGAIAHARKAYRYFVNARVVFEGEEQAKPLALPRLTRPQNESLATAKRLFVTLPLAVDRSLVFGTLQIESALELEESDLAFVDIVVNQLALGLARRSTEQTLRASEAKLAGILSTAKDAVISVDASQCIVMYNEGAEGIFGWKRGEVMGKPLDVLLPERFRKAHRQHIQRFASEPAKARKMAERRADICGLRKSGREFFAQAAISKLMVDSGWLFTAVLRDISQQQRMEHEDRFLAEIGTALARTLEYQETLATIVRLVVHEFGDFCVLYVVDEQGRLQQQEVAAADAAKATLADELKQVRLDPDRPHLGWSILRTRKSELLTEVPPEVLVSVSQSEEHRRLLDAVQPVSAMGVPLVVGNRLLGALVVATSQSEHRYGAMRLRFLEKVGQRAALALESARLYRSIKGAVQERDEMLAIVAHDLRSPLGTILAQAALLSHSREQSGLVFRRAAEVIQRAAGRMNRLIQDLVELTCIESGHLKAQSVAVSAERLIHLCVEAQEPLAASNSLQIRLDLAAALPPVWGDPDRILQVLENLIGNAIKFTKPGGSVTIGARARKSEVLFWVADTGSGITVNDFPHLFDRFWQARKADRRGAGLGLPIARGIIEAHGGSIWVKSTIGKGSTFYFTVPKAPSSSSA